MLEREQVSLISEKHDNFKEKIVKIRCIEMALSRKTHLYFERDQIASLNASGRK